MDLILWRHADAEEGLVDSARRLTAKGHKQAEKVAAWLRKRLPEEYLLLSSPAVRARETAEALSTDIRITADLDTGSGPASILRAAGWPEAGGTVVVVGHQPTLGAVAAKLLTGREEGWGSKKGAIWWFRSKSKGETAEVTLLAVLSPEMI